MADCTEALKLDPKGLLAPDSGASEDPWTGVHSATESYVQSTYARTTREGHLRKLRMAEVATGSDTTVCVFEHWQNWDVGVKVAIL